MNPWAVFKRGFMTYWYWHVRQLNVLWPSIALNEKTLVIFPGVYKPLENEQSCVDYCRKDDRVLDMGCGTGILAIMASKLGAKSVIAIDYDPICYESTIENARLNHVENITALCGSKEATPNEQFDIILANINRNILLDQMEQYARVLKPGGELYLSGFYEIPDLAIITDQSLKYGLKYVSSKINGDWVAAKVVR